MGRREHTIDGAIAIDRVYDALDGGGFLPLASCCSLSSLAAHLCCLGCFVLEIGCGRLLLVLVPWQLHLAGCWSTFDPCCLRESVVDLVDAFDLGLRGIAVLVWV